MSKFYVDHKRPFYPTKIKPMPQAEELDYAALSFQEIRLLLTAYGTTESAIVTDMNAHWKTRHKELIAWFEAR